MVKRDDVFRALSGPTRRKALELLAENNGQSLCALSEHLNMKRQSATRHIELLIEANLVTTVWKGQEKLHFINPIPIHEIYERWVRKFDWQELQMLRDP